MSPERQTTLSLAHGCRREGREGKREEGNVIGLNGTVNLPTCDLQAAKVGAKSDVPQLFLAIFRSCCSATHASACIFLSLLQVLDGIVPLITRRYQPRDQPRLGSREPPGQDPKTIGLVGRLSSGRSTVAVEDGTMSLPAFSFLPFVIAYACRQD